MITIHRVENKRTKNRQKYETMELRGLSTDEKPITSINGVYIDNGSIFIEIDTQKIFFYDLENEEWKGE